MPKSKSQEGGRTFANPRSSQTVTTRVTFTRWECLAMQKAHTEFGNPQPEEGVTLSHNPVFVDWGVRAGAIRGEVDTSQTAVVEPDCPSESNSYWPASITLTREEERAVLDATPADKLGNRADAFKRNSMLAQAIRYQVNEFLNEVQK